jgi:hypothetical protein
MFEIIVGTVIAFLSAVGAADLLSRAGRLLFDPAPGSMTLVITENGRDEAAEYRLRSLVAHYAAGLRETAGSRGVKIIVIDCGMDAETAEICVKIAEKYPCVSVCRPEEAARLAGAGML